MSRKRSTRRYSERPTGRKRASPWVVRVIAIVAVLVVLGAVAYTAANGVLFTSPGR